MLLDHTWKASAAAHNAGVTPNQLQIWLKRKLPLGTGIDGGGSQGSHRLFNFRNIMEFAVAHALTLQGFSVADAFSVAAKVAYTTTRERGLVLREAGFPFPECEGVSFLAITGGDALTSDVLTADRLMLHPALRGSADAVTLLNVSKVFRDVCNRIGDNPSEVLNAVYENYPRELADPAAQ
ncbi:hypothetical protein MAA5396_03560 [Marinovum algicola]|uniref:MerR HTH family regulatory protein n=1 Tax=Marinovum algicola TaxID=42444 RepID=A0A975ZPI3_9RHOB|nr:MerR family transcriptional regulator [Marinovum algicola]SEJ87825.1 MerR HTH family regulatory protein [Marinovum algicola]SLN66693.1 hypothetical protein MAA5396_03560 [Marinovum algicola]